MQASTSKRSKTATLMLKAAAEGDLVTMHSIYRRKGQSILYTASPDGATPIHLAAKRGQIRAIEYLIKLGVSLDEKDQDPKRQGNALHYACWGGDLELVRHLIDEHHMDLASVDVVGNTPLLYSIYGGHRAVVEELLRRGRSLRERNLKNHTAILQAACGGHLDLVDWLLDQGFSVRERDNDGNTALLFAAWGGHRELIQYLLSRGSSLSEQNFNGHTVFLSAANGGRVDIVEWLLEEGFSLSETNNNGDTAVLLAAYGGHLPLVKKLLQLGASLNERNVCGFTPLLSAANGGQLEMAQWLLKNGSRIDECDNDGYTSLILAACGGNIDLVKFFMDQGASIKEKNSNGDTALLLASYCGHAELVDWLLQNGSTLDERNNTKMGPLISAANGGHLPVVELLLERVANQGIEETDEGGYTPLLLAAQRGHFKVVQYLAAHGADLTAKTRRHQNDAVTLSMDFPDVQSFLVHVANMTPLEIAVELKMTNRVHYLITQGVDVKPSLLPLAESQSSAFTDAPEPDQELTLLLKHALLPYSPPRHELFGPQFKQCVGMVLNLECQLYRSAHLPILPHEIWLKITSFIQRSWFADSSSLEKLAPNSRNFPALTMWRSSELLGEPSHNESMMDVSSDEETDLLCLSFGDLKQSPVVFGMSVEEEPEVTEKKVVDDVASAFQKVSWV